MQPARGLIGAAVEFPAGVQHGHDHFEGGLFGKFRVRIDRHAAAVVGDAQIAALLERDLDECGVAGDRFVHRIVDHFGEQMMERVGIGPAHIHARPPAHRLEPLEHFDRGGGVTRFVRRAIAAVRFAVDGRGLAAAGRRGAEKIVHGLALLGVDSLRLQDSTASSRARMPGRVSNAGDRPGQTPRDGRARREAQTRRRRLNAELVGLDAPSRTTAISGCAKAASMGTPYAGSPRALPQRKWRHLVPWPGAGERTRFHYSSAQCAFWRPSLPH